MIRPVYLHGAHLHGAEVLRGRAHWIDFTDEPEQQALVRVLLGELLDDLRDTLWVLAGLHGVGLAAPQIGVGLRVAVIDAQALARVDGAPEPMEALQGQTLLELVNPQLLCAAGVKSRVARIREGCLSFPRLDVNVERARSVSVSYRDRHGAEHGFHAEGLLARCIQHEIDHLNGRVIADRCGTGERDLLSSKMRKVRRQLGDAYVPVARDSVAHQPVAHQTSEVRHGEPR